LISGDGLRLWTPPHLAKNGGKRNGIGGQSLVGHSAFYLIHNRGKIRH